MATDFICPACSGDSFENILNIKRLKVFSALKNKPFSETRAFDAVLLRCRRCGFVSQKLTSQLKRFLADFYKKQESFFTAPPNAPSKRTRFDVSFLKKYRNAKTKSILEIGAYDGYFLNLVGSNVHASELVGLEIMKKRNTYKNIRMIHDEYPTRKLSKRKFDLVILMNVLEHVFTPKEFMDAIKENLHENGSVIIEIPNEEHAFKAGALSFQHQHISYFTPRTIRLLLARCGFKIDGIYTKDLDRILLVCSKYSQKNKIAFKEDTSAKGYDKRVKKVIQKFKALTQGRKGAALYGAATATHNMMQIVPSALVNPLFDGDARKRGMYMSDNPNAISSGREIDSAGVGAVVIMPLSFTKAIYMDLRAQKIRTPIQKLFTIG
jgi:2-polyprenyl-3-methyl-5-hydroxy-6-metoxy-1,4-benzoquinol methylase